VKGGEIPAAKNVANITDQMVLEVEGGVPP